MKIVILSRFDEKDNLIVEAFKYNLLRTKLKKVISTTMIPKDSLIEHYNK
jgi:hypothetical protein